MTSSPKISLLFSYYFLARSKHLLEAARECSRRGHKVMIDSGAFSAWSTGKEIVLEDYTSFVKGYGVFPGTEFLNLDVIGNKAETKKNFLALRGLGVPVLPVIPAGMSSAEISDEFGSEPRVALGGLVQKPASYSIQRMAAARRALPTASLHGLGLARYPLLLQVGQQSCDTSSFMGGQKYGYLNYFSAAEGSLKISLIDFFDRSPKKEKQKMFWWKVLREHGVSVKDIEDASNWKGSSSLLSVAQASAYSALAKLAGKRGVDFYFVIMYPESLPVLLQEFKGGSKEGWTEKTGKSRQVQAHMKEDFSGAVSEMFNRWG